MINELVRKEISHNEKFIKKRFTIIYFYLNTLMYIAGYKGVSNILA